MVVFTCGHCGESVQKPKVEKHYMTKCRNRNPNLSCMDCFKDFFGNDYEQHTKCITEEQRYSAKGFVAKEKKGEQKQNAWVEMVQSVLDEQKGAPKNVLRILETVSKHNNTPRKKPKFINFVKNVCGHKTNPKDMDAAWDMISVKLAALSTQNNTKTQKTESEADSDEKASESQTANLSVAKLSISEAEDNTQQDDEPKANAEATEDKKSKKQKKEEKKRKKYEAELQSANNIPEEDEEEPEKPSKKEKKKKNKGEVHNDDDNQNTEEENNKKMKRKRQDTVNSVGEAAEIAHDAQVTEKTKKKKPKQESQEESPLHEQHIGNTMANGGKADIFSWHAVIMSVLEKKGPEVQFKRLQKKVLSEYYEVTGQEVDDRIVDKFIKKLRSAPNVRVDKNRVLLVQ